MCPQRYRCDVFGINTRQCISEGFKIVLNTRLRTCQIDLRQGYMTLENFLRTQTETWHNLTRLTEDYD